MSLKQVQAGILLGVFLGAFSALWHIDIPPKKEAPFRTDSRQINEVLTGSKGPISQIAKDEEPNEQKTGEDADETTPENNPAVSDTPKKDQSGGSLKLKPVHGTILHQNRELSNYNIMFFGIEEKKLQMLTVYSINKENQWKSGTVFVPTDTLVPGTKNQSIAEFFYQNGPEEVKRVIQTNMEIEIDYYVLVDRNLLYAVEPYLDPIYVDGEKINLAQLFTKEITPQDEIILGSLLKNLTKPSVYFGVLPKLVWTCKQYITTDFELNWPNLWVHYQIAKNIDTSAVTKRILPGTYVNMNGKRLWVPTQDAWWNTVYGVTK